MSNHNPPANGFDKRKHQINRKGRPKSFDALRVLAQQIAHERATVGGEPSDKTIVEMILRSWAVSKNPQLQRAFVEIAFGKVPDKLDVTSGDQPLTIRVIYDKTIGFDAETTEADT